MTANTLAVPVHIRAAERDLSADDRRYIRGKLGRMLGKFAGNIVRVSIRTHDENGPRGGVDRVCRIKVVLMGLPSALFEKRDPAMNAAVDGALSGIEQAVRRAVQRRRMKPRRGSSSRGGAVRTPEASFQPSALMQSRRVTSTWRTPALEKSPSPSP